MPLHDWTRGPAGLFHFFHQKWIQVLCDCLNFGGLPKGYYALSEQVVRGPIPDVLTLRLSDDDADEPPLGSVSPVVTAEFKAHTIQKAEVEAYAARADRLVIRAPRGRVVAVIEIVSAGNKSSKNALCTFVEKSVDYLKNGVHLLVIDVHPPTRRDPQGIHKAIWEEITDEFFELPEDKNRTVVSYSADEISVAYVQPIAVSEPLPDAPLFVSTDAYVLVPLERTYMDTWSRCPEPLQEIFED